MDEGKKNHSASPKWMGCVTTNDGYTMHTIGNQVSFIILEILIPTEVACLDHRAFNFVGLAKDIKEDLSPFA